MFMKSFIYGTGNPAKLQYMRKSLAPLAIEIIGVNEIDATLPIIDESGNSPLENSRIKALAYYAALKQPVFACDSGLYIDGLSDEEQPGIHVRRIGNRTLNDEEMTAHYAKVARGLGGKAKARYKNAICLVISEEVIYEHFGDDISGEEFYLVDKPHPKRVEGFPLDCISARIDDGSYYYDYERDSVASGDMAIGFQTFFYRVMKGR